MLYNKRLRNFNELKAEQKALREKLAQSEEKQSKNVTKTTKRAKSKDAAFVSGVFSGAEMMAGSFKFGGLLKIASQFLLPLAIERTATYGIRKIVFKVAREVSVGYLKWKAVEIAASLIYKKVKQKKEV